MPRHAPEIARSIYSGLWTASLPLVMARLWWKGRRQPEYRAHIGERFGHYTGDRIPWCIWLHAVSVGETRAAEPVIRGLRQAYPDIPIVLTHMTPTGRATAQSLYSDRDTMIRSVYLPYDLRALQRRFIRHFEPLIGIVMETEVWPNLLAECREQGVPTGLINARLSERSARRYETMGGLARTAFSSFDLIAAQSDEDASRFSRFRNAPIEVTGNIKFDNHPSDEQRALGQRFRDAAGTRHVVLAASTREGEEALLLAAANELRRDDVLLVIVPRHPQRFDEVANLAAQAGYRVGRRSASDGPSPDDEIWIGDSMGEMTAYFSMADVTLMGGTWRDLGGQNFIECCAVGTPVLLGPSVFNFAQAAEQALASGAARQCADPAEAFRTARQLLGNDALRGEMGSKGRRFAQAHGGATERTLALLHPLIDRALAQRP